MAILRNPSTTHPPSTTGVVADHHQRIRALEANPITAHYEIKVVSDFDELVVGDDAFVWMVPLDIDEFVFTDAQAFVSVTSSSGVPTIQLRNVTQALDILSTPITIDVGDLTSYDATTRRVISDTNRHVNTGDLIAIDVDVAGTGAKGLGVVIVLAAY